MGEVSIRDGDVGGDEANAERETRNAEYTGGRQFRVPRSDFRVDQDQARLLGLSSQDLAQSLNTVLSGVTATQVRSGIYLVDVLVRASAEQRMSLSTIRTLQVNGYSLREVPEQVCCGALHAHAGLRAEARLLARANVAAFGEGDEPIVVNSAGCGAMLKEYGHLVDAAGFTARVRDVTELLAAGGGPRPGAPVDVQVAYDPPCHLLHAQRIADEPLRVLAAIPVLRVMSLPDAAQCCGSAGLFTLLEPAMSRAVLAPKLASLRAAAPQVVATGNPGCVMQLGAGLAASGVATAVRHPVELLDESYRAAGYYA